MKNVLLVEDETIISEPLGIVLEAAGHKVDIASNGEEGLSFVSKGDYDAILLDIMMPICSGIEFLKRFDSDKRKRTKIILLTNLADGKEINEALRLGVDKAILKASITPSLLLETIAEQTSDSV